MAGLAALSWIGDVCTATLIRVRGEMEDCEDLLTFGDFSVLFHISKIDQFAF